MKPVFIRKKYLVILLLAVLCILMVVPIPIPMHKKLSGVSYNNSQVSGMEKTSIEIDGTYWFRVIGKDEFRGNFAISAEPDTMSDAITAQIGPLNGMTVSKVGMFFYSEIGQGNIKIKNAVIGYFSPFMGKVLITNEKSVREEECHIIAAPADTYENAQKLIESMNAF